MSPVTRESDPRLLRPQVEHTLAVAPEDDVVGPGAGGRSPAQHRGRRSRARGLRAGRRGLRAPRGDEPRTGGLLPNRRARPRPGWHTGRRHGWYRRRRRRVGRLSDPPSRQPVVHRPRRRSRDGANGAHGMTAGRDGKRSTRRRRGRCDLRKRESAHHHGDGERAPRERERGLPNAEPDRCRIASVRIEAARQSRGASGRATVERAVRRPHPRPRGELGIDETELGADQGARTVGAR